MKWEDKLCFAAIPLSILLAVSAVLGQTGWTILGLSVASALVIATLVVRKQPDTAPDMKYGEAISCERSNQYIAIDQDGEVIVGLRGLQFKLESRQILSADIKANSAVVSMGRNGIDLTRTRTAGSGTISSLTLELVTSNASVPHLTIHLLADGKSRHPESLAVRRALSRAEHWLRNLRA